MRFDESPRGGYRLQSQNVPEALHTALMDFDGPGIHYICITIVTIMDIYLKCLLQPIQLFNLLVSCRGFLRSVWNCRLLKNMSCF